MCKLTTRTVISTLLVLFSTSCLHAQSVDEQEIAGLSAALLKVSGTVHSAVRFKNADPKLSDDALLTFATAHMPSYLDRFNGYVLKARQEDKNSSVLVCDKSGKIALIEDAGCTSPSDWHATQQNLPCEYILDLAATCTAH